MTLRWRGRTASFWPYSTPASLPRGMSASTPVDIESPGSMDFTVELVMNGSRRLHLIPNGELTTATMVSPWRDPSFSGSFLPKSRSIGKDGFSAEWGPIARQPDQPRQWLGVARTLNMQALEASGFGVDFATPTDTYAKTRRSTTYSLLFIAMTLLTFYLLELFRHNRVHMLQYGLVGLALCLFYLLLLSLSEHLSFGVAYALSLAAILLLVGLYSWAVFGRAIDALGVGAAVGALYGYLYVVLNAEDHALLFGSLGLFAMLAMIMYATRRLNREGSGALSEA
jgi:inner membrane protein